MAIKNSLLSRLFQAHWSFVFIGLLFGGLFIAMNPPLWGADEGAHFFRAYQVSQGQINQPKLIENGKSLGGYIPDSFKRLDTLKVSDIADNPSGNPARQVDSVGAYMKIGNSIPSRERNVANPYSPIIYPAVTYIAPATAMAIVNPFHPSTIALLYIARTATLLFYIAVVAIALYLLRNSSIKWILFLVALLPMSLYDASIVSADPILLSLTLLFIAASYRLALSNHITRWEIVSVALPAIALTYVKPPYIILVFTLFFLPLKTTVAKLDKKIIRLIIPTLCIVVAIGSILSLGSTVVGSVDTVPGVSAMGQLKWMLQHPIGYVLMLVNSVNMINWLPQMVGIFGTSFIFIPGPIFQIILVWLTLSTFMTDKNSEESRNRFGGFIYIAAAVITSIAVITVLYLTWTPVGGSFVQGVQGRYFLPMLAFAMIGARMIFKQRLIVEKSWKISAMNMGIVIFCLLGSILFYYKVLY